MNSYNDNINNEKKIVIFGAGEIGGYALERYGDAVAYFIDNGRAIQGNMINGKIVKSVEEFLTEKDLYQVVIASTYQEEMKKQLVAAGVTDYMFYLDDWRALLCNRSANRKSI